MFKPGTPTPPTHEPSRRPPPEGAARFSLAGPVCAGVGLLSLIYGNLVHDAASPVSGEGLIAGLLGGIAASMGQIFVSTGWVLMGAGALLWLATRWLQSRSSS